MPTDRDRAVPPSAPRPLAPKIRLKAQGASREPAGGTANRRLRRGDKALPPVRPGRQPPSLAARLEPRRGHVSPPPSGPRGRAPPPAAPPGAGAAGPHAMGAPGARWLRCSPPAVTSPDTSAFPGGAGRRFLPASCRAPRPAGHVHGPTRGPTRPRSHCRVQQRADEGARGDQARRRAAGAGLPERPPTAPTLGPASPHRHRHPRSHLEPRSTDGCSQHVGKGTSQGPAPPQRVRGLRAGGRHSNRAARARGFEPVQAAFSLIFALPNDIQHVVFFKLYVFYAIFKTFFLL